MTTAVHQLLSLCVHGKGADQFVFTRNNGAPVKDFRGTWARACCAAGVGRMVCVTCAAELAQCTCPKELVCAKCGGESEKCECPKQSQPTKYVGLIFHDLRRTAARNLRRAGNAEGVIMKIGGWRTRSVFERYAIVSQSDISDALRNLEKFENGHSSGTVEPQTETTTSHDLPLQ
jgi:hypothetical protein